MTSVECNHCNYKWDTKSTKIYVTCSSCMLKIHIENCIVPEFTDTISPLTELVLNSFDTIMKIEEVYSK